MEKNKNRNDSQWYNWSKNEIVIPWTWTLVYDLYPRSVDVEMASEFWNRRILVNLTWAVIVRIKPCSSYTKW